MLYSFCFCLDELAFLSEDSGINISADSYQKLLPRLGLSDRKSIPEPVRFLDPDPLGAKSVTNSTSEVTTESLSECFLSNTSHLPMKIYLIINEEIVCKVYNI